MRPPKIKYLLVTDKIRTTGVSSKKTEQIYFLKGNVLQQFP